MSIYFVDDVAEQEPHDFQEQYENYLDRLDVRKEIILDDDLED